MSVENILHQLLLEHECVILPNFGGFIVRESPCNYNVAKEIIKPFSKSIFFNQHLLENDGLLINALSRINNIPYNDATIQVENWINGLSSQIESQGKLSIRNIGSFTRGSEGNKWFAADPTLNLSLQTYGLRPVKAAIISESIIEQSEPVYEIKPLADNKPIETFAIKKTNWKAWLAAASIALVAHIGYLTIEGFQNKNSNQASVINLPVVAKTDEPLASAVVADTNTIITETIESTPESTAPTTEVVTTTSPIIETAPVENNEVKVEPTITAPETTLREPAPIVEATTETVVGRYKLEVNALNHIKDLSKNGVIGRIEKNTLGLYEVKVSNNN